MSSPTAVWSLRWSDVDPSIHPFDPAAARRIAMAKLSPYRLEGPSHEEARERAEDDIDRAFIAEYGFWAAGWRWAASEPGCGGFVRAYCCADDSLGRGFEADVETVVAALTDFRQRIETLSLELDRIRESSHTLEPAERVERAAAALLPIVVEWTDAQDSWYATFTSVLSWFLEPLSNDPVEVRALVKEAIGGRFHSWVAPDEGVAAAVATSVGKAVVALAGENRVPFDALATWSGLRSRVRRAERLFEIEPLTLDGHEVFIETRDHPRDSLRAERMRAALVAAREDAIRGRPLDYERLRTWQRIVLGSDDVRFRTSVAFAHGGREMYGLPEGIEAHFDRCLSEARDESLTPEARASRVYLDVCFFHPFADGNARAARLALDYVLTASGRGLHAAEPIFIVARSARDEHGAGHFHHVVEYLVGLRTGALALTGGRL